METKNMETKHHTWSRFLLCLAVLEITIAAIASSGLGINTLATTDGVADIKLRYVGTTVGQYYAHLAMKVDAYEFSGHLEDSDYINHRRYTYKESYESSCGTNAPAQNSTRNCNFRFAVWQWTRAFTTLGTIACVIVFVTGVILFFLACCRERMFHQCCKHNEMNEMNETNEMNGMNGMKNEKDKKCCRCLWSCTTEFVLVMLNFLVFLLFAFSWAIILGLKFAKHLNNVIADAANKALNDNQDVEYYDFTFDRVKAGDSLWPLAVASLLALLVTMYLIIAMCWRCCNKSSMKSTPNSNTKPKNNTMEMV